MNAAEMTRPRFKARPSRDLTRPGFADHDRWLLLLLHQRLREAVAGLPTGDTVLDYGCGLMPYRELFESRFSTYVGADLEGNPAAGVTIRPDGTLPMPDASVDVVLSSQVLEHVTDPAAYLAEAHRVLRPGGHVVVSTHGAWVYHPDPTDFWRWTPDGLRLILSRAGFEVERMDSVLGLLSLTMQLWLSGTYWKLPRGVRAVPAAMVQTAIGFIEGRRRGRFSTDAAIYVVVASK
jgi:SAM-dependent methyltransferase